MIQSPGFPYSSSAGTRCRFAVTTVPSKKISVYFGSFWSSPYQETNCTTSYLKVYNGLSDTADLLGNFCGRRTPPTLHSSGSNLYFDYVIGPEGYGKYAMSYVTSGATIQVLLIVFYS